MGRTEQKENKTQCFLFMSQKRLRCEQIEIDKRESQKKMLKKRWKLLLMSSTRNECRVQIPSYAVSFDCVMPSSISTRRRRVRFRTNTFQHGMNLSLLVPCSFCPKPICICMLTRHENRLVLHPALVRRPGTLLPRQKCRRAPFFNVTFTAKNCLTTSKMLNHAHNLHIPLVKRKFHSNSSFPRTATLCNKL